MQHLIDELKRRNVFRVAIAFVVASWLIIQIVETVLPSFGFGDYAVRYVVIALGIAFLPVTTLAWVFELTPAGVRLQRDIDSGRVMPATVGRKLDRVVITALVVVTMWLALDKFVPLAGDSAAPLAEPHESIVVLPFVDLSEDSDQEYFSDGMSDELINLLAQVPNLRVISRSSAFSFKAQTQDVRAIAKQLNVKHVLDGSVRKAGDRLRVTVQLVDAETDVNLFSQSYDRTLDDVFEIQDDIARGVVQQLKLILLDDGPRPSPAAPEAYEAYLRGRYLADQTDETSLREAQAEFEQALRIAPDFADAWIGLGDIHRYRASRGLVNQHVGLEKARHAAETALALDPRNAGAYVLRGRLSREFDWDWRAADADFHKAIMLDPNSAAALRYAAGLAATLGRTDEAVNLAHRAVLRDPLSLTSLQNLAILQFYAGQYPDADATLSRLIERDARYSTAYAFRSWVYALTGRNSEAMEAALKEPEDPLRLISATIASYAAGDVPAGDDHLRAVIDNYGDVWCYQIAEIYAFSNQTDKAFEWLAKAHAARDTGLPNLLVDPFFESLHGDARWIAMINRLGLKES